MCQFVYRMVKYRLGILKIRKNRTIVCKNGHSIPNPDKCLQIFCTRKLNFLNFRVLYISPVWKIQKMVKNPCLSVKNMRIGCEKFQKKFGLNWRFPWGAIAKTCSLAFCSAICPLHVIYKAICGPKKIHPVCLTFEPLRLQMTTIA